MVCQRACVQDRLIGAVAPDRIQRMCGIAQQRRSAERPMWKGIAIAIGKLEERRGLLDDRHRINEVEPKSPNEVQCLTEMAAPAPVLARGALRSRSRRVPSPPSWSDAVSVCR